MKKKFFFLFVFIFGLCGVFGSFNLTLSSVQAASPSSSVWTGNLDDVTSPTPQDWFEDGNNFYIHSAKGLAYFINSVNKSGNTYSGKTILLEVDIDWNNKNWATIGAQSVQFNGTFNGQGHTVYNVNMESGANAENYVGFFGVLGASAVIQNLHLRNLTINTSEMNFVASENVYVGGIAAFSDSSSAEICNISNCSVGGSIVVQNNGTNTFSVGGVFGGGVALISNCFSSASILASGRNLNVGGLVGTSNNLRLNGSFSNGSIMTNAESNNCLLNVGGLVGSTESRATIIENCFNTANLQSSTLTTGERMGGLVGRAESGSLRINHAYNAGDLKYISAEGNRYAGFVGSCSIAATIENAFTIGQLALSTQLSANTDFLYNGSGATLTNVYSSAASTNAQNVVHNLETLARTRDFYRNTAYFSVDWDFSSIWSISSSLNNSLPYINLNVLSGDENQTFDKEADIKLRGNGTANSPFLIETVGDLGYLSTLSDYADENGAPYYFSVQNNLDLTGKTWQPIGTLSNFGFNGVFDGNGFEISGLTCTLQENFQNVGLFAETNNAVIKNLTLGKANFLGFSSTGVYVGTLIGNVKGDTYLVNCLDASGADEKSVANVESGKLYVALGKSNYTSGAELVNLNLSGISYEKAYDVTISAEGGNFYDTNRSSDTQLSNAELLQEEMYLAEYHVLLSAGAIVVSTPDTTFGKGGKVEKEGATQTLPLPQNSSQIGHSDVLIRRGFRLKGFAYQTGSAQLGLEDTFVDLERAVQGLKAVWEETDVTVRVVYNQYEIANFGANTEGGFAYGKIVLDGVESESVLQLGGEDGKQVFVDYTLPYDAYFSEISSIFTIPQYYDSYGRIKILRDGNFTLDSIYGKFVENDFAGVQYSALSQYIINDQFLAANDSDANGCVLYVKWQGKEKDENPDNINVVTVRFVTEDETIDLTTQDIVEEVYLTETKQSQAQNGEMTSETKTINSVLGEMQKNMLLYDIAFDTAFSASKNEFLSLQTSLANGYEMKGNPTITRNNNFFPLDPNTGVDTNFGVFTSTNSSGEYLTVDKLSSLSNVALYNLVGQYTITITIQRADYNDDLFVQGDVTFGISPLQTFTVTRNGTTFSSGVEIYTTSGTYVDVLDVISLTAEEKTALANSEQPLYVAFDVKNNQILFSSNIFDAKYYSFGDLFTFRFNQSGVYKTYTIQKARTYEQNEVVKQEIILTEVKVGEDNQVLLTLDLDKDGKYTNLRYTAKNSFVLIVSTENESSNFSECTYFSTNSPLVNSECVKTIELKKNSENVGDFGSKFLFKFSDVVRENETGDNSLEIVLQYTDAMFTFDFEYDGTTAPDNFLSNTPHVSFEENADVLQKTFDVSSSEEAEREVVLYVTMSDRFKLKSVLDEFGNETVALKNANNMHNISIQVKNSNLGDVENKQEVQEAYENAFNQNNTRFFSSIRMQKLTLQSSDAKTTYKITLAFNPNYNGETGLQAGHYTINLICTDVLYSINYDTKFLTNDNLQSFAGLFGNSSSAVDAYGFENEYQNQLPLNFLDIKYAREGETLDYVELAPKENYDRNFKDNVVENVNGRPVTVRSYAGESLIKFDDKITLKNNLPDGNNQYAFYGFYVRGGNVKTIIPASRVTSDGYVADFSNLYSLLSLDNIYGAENQVTIFALYVKKQFNMTLNGKVTIQDKNGIEGSENASASTLGITLAMDNVSGQAFEEGIGYGVTNGTYTFTYTSSILEDAASPKNEIVLSLGGYNANGYYFAGYKILDLAQNTIFQSKEYSVDVLGGTMTVDLGWLKEEVEKGSIVGNAYLQNYYFQPIIKQKQVEIFFHSGTGDSNNQFGDTYSGKVSNALGQDSTNEVYQFGNTLYFGNSQDLTQQLSLLTKDGAAISSKLFDLFASRVGYSSSGRYWAWKNGNNLGVLSASHRLDLTSNFFSGIGEVSQVHFYLIWQANSYTIRFDRNANEDLYFGSATGTTIDSFATYDGIVALPKDMFEFVGYDFAGWSLDNNATSVETATSFSDIRSKGAGVYKIGTKETGFEYYAYNLTQNNGQAVTLFAVWEAKTFKVEINYNSGMHNDKAVETFELTYNHTFADIALNNLGKEIVRKGFDFAGFYLLSEDGLQSAQVDENTRFNTSLLSSNFANYTDGNIPIVLTLYATWNYSTSLQLSLTNNTIFSTYNGDTQIYSIADFFEDGNFISFGLDVEKQSGGNLSFVITSAHDVTWTATLTLDGVQTTDIRAFDAGEYVFLYTLTISDNSEFFQKGVLQTIRISLVLSVERAELSLKIDDEIKFANAKKIMAPFVEIDNSITNLSALVRFVKGLETDNLIQYASDDEVYEYIAVKYYFLMTSSGQEYKKYRQWTYQDFDQYRASASADVEEILGKMQFFTFFSLETTSTKIPVADYEKYITFTNDNVIGVSGDVVVQQNGAKLVSVISSIQAQTSYELRIYLNKTARIENYVVSQDGDEYYINIGQIYVMPMPLVVTNASDNTSVYYSSQYQERQVDFAVNSEQQTFNDKTYFKVGDINGSPLFVSATLYTSNEGKYNESVEFRFKDNENFLYFAEENFVLQSQGILWDYSSNFKLILDNESAFQIIRISDIFQLDLNAKYLTIVDGEQVCDTITSQNPYLSDLASVPVDLLEVSTVYYNLTGTEQSVSVAQHPSQFITEDGALIYMISNTGENKKTLMLNSVVTRLEFVAKTQVGQFISLYKWHAGEYDQVGVDGDVYANNSFTLEMSDFVLSTDGLTIINFNAIYTDLVKVRYDLKFPADYDSWTQETNFIRLGYASVDDFPFPQEDGLKCVSLLLSGSDIDLKTEKGQSEFFAGEGGTYVGLNASNLRATLTFSALWEVDELEGETVVTQVRLPVASFDSLYADDVLQLYNKNELIYDYEYQWFKLDENGTYVFVEDGIERKYSLLSNTDLLTLKEGGSSKESGTYKVCVVAKLKDKFLNCVSGNTSTQLQSNITLTFMRHKLDDLSLPENASATYNGIDQITDWKVDVSYFEFDPDIEVDGEYSTTATTSQMGYVADGAVSFEIFFGGDETSGTKVTEMKNAGTYYVYVRFDESKFDLSDFNGKTYFIYTINPYVVDLNDFSFDNQKIFNEQDPSLDKEIALSDDVLNNHERVSISLTRQAGEDVGQYDILLTENQNENYVFTLGGFTLWENGKLTESGKEQGVGKFTISASGILMLSFEEKKIQKTYSNDGFTLEVNNNLQLLIKNGTTTVSVLDLSLYDVRLGLTIEDEAILAILKTHLGEVGAKFTIASNEFAVAKDCATYYFQFVAGETFGKYYETVVMTQEHSFEIMPQEIDVSGITFEKVFAGEGDRTAEFDIPNWDGLKVVATFDSAHVARNADGSIANVGASLSLVASSDSTLNVDNFRLKQTYIQGKILPLKATLTLAMTKQTYVYGEVSLYNLSNLISIDSVMANGVDVKNTLLQADYYSISYALPDTVASNASGFVFAGNFNVVTSAVFQDFDMEISNLSFAITAREFVAQIYENYITITTNDAFAGNYERTQAISETNDTFTIDLVVVKDGAQVESVQEGIYDLALLDENGNIAQQLVLKLSDKDSLGSVVVSVPEDNKGFRVVSATDTIYVSIDNDSILTQTYNGSAYQLSTGADNQTLLVNGQSSALKFYKYSADGEKQSVNDVSFTSFEIYALVDEKRVATFQNAGRYYLNLSAVAASGGIGSVVFEKEYYFTINQIVINANNLAFAKIYDGKTDIKTSVFDEKIGTEDVTISGIFASANVGTDIAVNSLQLEGTNKQNYVLSANVGSGQITQALATLSLTQTTFAYGEIAMFDGTLNNALKLKVEVKSDGKIVAENQYSLSVALSATESDFATLGYLKVGSYDVVISDLMKGNYKIENLEEQIVVAQREISIEFSRDGEVALEYTTPLDGVNVPYTISANSANSPLGEAIVLTLKRNSSEVEIGKYYRIINGTYESADGNYRVSVTDSSNNGAFVLTASSTQVFVLLADGTTEINLTYDGNTYDKVEVVQAADETWQLVISSTASGTKHNFALGFFTSTNDVLTPFAGQVKGLSSNLSFVENAKNVRSYDISADNTTSTTISYIRMGNDRARYAFTLNINKKDLYFNSNATLQDGTKLIENNIFIQAFNNSTAQYSFQDSGLLLDGLVDGDSVKLNVQFFTDSNKTTLAKYVGENLKFDASLVDAENYVLNLSSRPTATLPDGVAIIGEISKAKISLDVSNQYFTYGDLGLVAGKFDSSKIERTFVSTEFDLAAYFEEIGNLGISRQFEFAFDVANGSYSTSSNLNVGEFALTIASFVADDFVLDENSLAAKVFVSKKRLEIAETTTPLQQIFTKKYDGKRTAVIKSADGELLFGISGIVRGDVVGIGAAAFAKEIGSPLDVTFVLDGRDSANYEIAVYPNGTITDVKVGIIFDYHNMSGVTSNVESEVSELSYPFQFGGSLTDNASAASSKLFPGQLVGYAGMEFDFWTIDFQVNSEQLKFLQGLGVELIDKGGNVYGVKVANNAATVRFLSELLSDEDDTFGRYYYASHDNITFTFTPNWKVLQHEIKVQIADENGFRDSSLGSVTLEVDGEDISTSNDNLSGQFNFGTKVILRVSLNEHRDYVGFYLPDGTTLKTSSNVIIGRNGNQIVLTINQLNADFNLVVRLEVEKIDAVIDLKDGQSLKLSSSSNFILKSDGKYHWLVDYYTLQNKKMSDLPTIEKTGYDFVGMLANGVEISSADFATTQILPYVQNLSLTLEAVMQAKEVIVTLDYGYDTPTKQLTAKFDDTYSQSVGWEENPPQRTGFTFVAWIDETGSRVTGDSVVKNVNAHTLTARWEAAKHNIELTCNNATISGTTKFTKVGNQYIARDVEYGTQISFTVTIDKRGYLLSDNGWDSMFTSVRVYADGTKADVVLTMPDFDVAFTLPIQALTNTVTVTGEKVVKVEAFEIDDEETEIEVNENAFQIETGRKLKIKVYAQTGWQPDREISFDDASDLSYTTKVEDGVLIITFEEINHNVTISCKASAGANTITLKFSDSNAVERIEDEQGRVVSLTSPSISALTETSPIFFVKFKHGYEFDGVAGDFSDIRHQEITLGTYAGYVKFEIPQISASGTVSIASKAAKFKLTAKVVSNSDNGVVEESANKILYKDGDVFVELIEAEFDFGQQVTLSYEKLAFYNFAGWKLSETAEPISFATEFTFTVEDDQTIYAIFSTTELSVSLGALDFSLLYSEYGQDKEQQNFRVINNVMFTQTDSESGQEVQIEAISVFFGSSTNINISIPDGYLYYGFGYYVGDDFHFVKEKENLSGEKVAVTISSADFGNVTPEKLFIVLTARSVTVDVSTKIVFSGVIQSDIGVGDVSLSSADAGDVNEFGYVDGTRVHYSHRVNERQFSVEAYTGDFVYLKIKTAKQGYVFDSIAASADNIYIELVSEAQDYLLYRVYGFVGGSPNIQVEIAFRPSINIVDISFTSENGFVNGGAIEIVDMESVKQVWTSGQDYHSISVSAFTGSSFKVVAYISAGFDGSNLKIEDADGIVVAGSLTYSAMSIEETGFSGKITFVVRGFFNKNSINIDLTPNTYTVLLKDGDKTLAQISNVKFGQALNLSQENANNIQILDSRLGFVDGRLSVVLKKEGYNFEGYFTYQGGAGVRYINSNGAASAVWQESGYVYNSITNKFQLSGNAAQNENGEIEISLYVYQSYLKTRIEFTFEPNIKNLTAQDMLSGVDYTNSWFYSSNPNYIEVAFSTDVYITAPEIDGYKFYKFVINQKMGDGTWLNEVTAYTGRFPWSTNEFDNIVEVQIRVVYFAQIEVQYIGGEGSFEITQRGADSTEQALALFREGYVDTTKDFIIKAIAGDGYVFQRWFNTETGQRRENAEFPLFTNHKVVLQMYLEGKQVTLDFSEYDRTYGQIIRVEKISAGSAIAVPIEYNQAKVNVGDTIRFVLKIESGFAVVWNRSDILYETYFSATGEYYFNKQIVFADAPTEDDPEKVLAIIPTFQNNIYSIYINRQFADGEFLSNAVDDNNVELAGYVSYLGGKSDFFTVSVGENVEFEVVANPRYQIAKITIENFGKSIEFEIVDGKISLTDNFLTTHGIKGILSVNVQYCRLHWQQETLEKDGFEGKGDARNPYQISSVEDLILMMKLCNDGQVNEAGLEYRKCSYILMCDINLEEKFWTPIGTTEFAFDGAFNFNGHKITGINVSIFHKTLAYNGLFGVLGSHANIIENSTSLWWLYLIIAIVVALAILLVILLLVARKRKKEREELEKR